VGLLSFNDPLCCFVLRPSTCDREDADLLILVAAECDEMWSRTESCFRPVRLAPHLRGEGNTRELGTDEAVVVARRLLKAKGRRMDYGPVGIACSGPSSKIKGSEDA
jgi:hypothetical protein